MQSERTLTSAEGLPRRPWFRHQLYAPGFYTGYGVKTMPGVREAIEQKNWKEADDQIGRVAQTLTAEAALLDRATGAAEALAREGLTREREPGGKASRPGTGGGSEQGTPLAAPPR